jgi:hypothetical protein
MTRADLEDRYENRLRAMIDVKVAGVPLEPEERVYERSNVLDAGPNRPQLRSRAKGAGLTPAEAHHAVAAH